MSILPKHKQLTLFIRQLLIAVPVLFCLFLAAPSCFAKEDGFNSPVHYADFREIFGRIISENGLYNDPEMVLQLSNECKVEYVTPASSKDGQLAVMTVNLINPESGVNELRGASNNGTYYVLQITPTGMDLIGILEGNSWKQKTIDGKDAFVTTWHMSAFEYIETDYVFNGKVFQKTNSRTIKSDVNK
jgi:hypothetical protein